MPKPLGSSRYMPGLDGLRAIAVFAVIAYHLNLSWVPGGLLGVGIFFVLSGYLITDILFKQHAKMGRLDLRDFWIRRARRLLPAMMIMLALVTLWLMITDTSRLASMKGEIVSALLYYSNWRLIFHDVSYFESFGPPSPLGHLWSLVVEEQFYLVWPLTLVFLIRIVKHRGRLMLWILTGAALSAGAMALIYVPGLDPSRVYYGTDTRAFGLLIGAALAVVWPSWKLRESVSRRGRMMVDIVGTGGLIIIGLMIVLVGEYDAFLYRGGMVLLSVATAAVVAAMALPASRLARLIGSKPLQWFGARSYGIYLYHYPVIALSTPAAQMNEFHPLRALIQVLTSIALAELSWRYVEEPIRHGALGKLRSNWLKPGQGRLAGRRRRGLMLTCVCALVIVNVSCSNKNNLVQGDDGKASTESGQAANADATGANDLGVPAGDHAAGNGAAVTGDQSGGLADKPETGSGSVNSGVSTNGGGADGKGSEGGVTPGTTEPGGVTGAGSVPGYEGSGNIGDEGEAASADGSGDAGSGSDGNAGGGSEGGSSVNGSGGSPGSADGGTIGSAGSTDGGNEGSAGSGSVGNTGSADNGSAGSTGNADGGSTGSTGSVGGSTGSDAANNGVTGDNATNNDANGASGNNGAATGNTGNNTLEGNLPVGTVGGAANPPAPPILSDAKDGITVIGDSVILDAKPFLEQLVKGIVIDGKVGRQLSQADDVVADLKQRKQLGKTVVIELGTNGSFTEKQLQQLLDAIGTDRTIYFVNTRVPRKWQDAVNDMLADTVANAPNMKLIDWYTASEHHEDFFGKDGVHLKRSGGEFFANLIVSSLG